MSTPLAPPKHRGNRTVLWVLTGSTVLVVAILVAFIALVSQGDQKWQEMEDSIARLRLEAQRRSTVRAVPGGTAVPGNAWDEYGKALTKVGALVDENQLTDFLDSGKNPQEVRQTLRDRADALELLHRGAHRSDGGYVYAWQLGRDLRMPGTLEESRALALLAAAKARILVEQGQVHEAADVLVDTSMFGSDMGRNGGLASSFIGITVQDVAFKEARNLIDSGKLTRKEMVEFAERLEVLDRDFPKLGPAFVNSAMGLGIDMLRGSDSTTSILGPLGSGLSARAVSADAFHEIEGFMRRAEKWDDLPFSIAHKEAIQITEELRSSPNPLTRQNVANIDYVMPPHRESLAHLRLVRAAAIYRITGNVPELDDPLGDKLLHKADNGTVKIWSIGRNQKDDGGLGTWNDTTRQDILLEIRK